MSCCQNNSSHDEYPEEEKKKSWKVTVAALVILGLLVFSILGGFMLH